MNPFDYVKAINNKKEVEHKREYNPFLTNVSLSYTLDTVLFANEMNRYPNLPPECQYDFLFSSIRKGNRWAKWYKEDKHPHLELVQEYYKCSKERALEYLQVLTQDNLRDMMSNMDRGGK